MSYDIHELIAKNEYNELGQLITKQVGGTDVTTFAGLQKVDYEYNIRGWLKGINDIENLQKVGAPKDLFAFKINYDTAENTVEDVKPLYNGNISETFWRTSSDNIVRKYGYKYDDLNRLNKAIYQKPQSAYPVTHMYDEEISYDKNGNIQHLNRFGDLDDPWASNAIQLDDLTYSYDTNNKNLLLKVTDASEHPKGFTDDINGTSASGPDDYTYDAFGNLTSDANKKITKITYNHLNLPVLISFGALGSIQYLYNAAGQKVNKRVISGGVGISTDYLDGYQYVNEVLKFFPHAEGYVNASEITSFNGKRYYKFNYVYNYVDHLGNVRVSYGFDEKYQTLKIIEQNHYYPFGLKHTKYNTEKKKYEILLDDNGNPITGIIPDNTNVGIGNGRYNYKLNNREFQDELGLNMYAMDMRQYDPAIGRWVAQDPVIHYDVSPYSAFNNNPVLFADPSGADSESDYFFSHDGQGREKFDKVTKIFIAPDDRVDDGTGSKFEGNYVITGDSIDKDVGQWLQGVDGNMHHIDGSDFIDIKPVLNFALLLLNYPKPYSPGPYSQELYFNQCAIRLSIALLRSGVDLSTVKNLSNPGGTTFTKKGEVLGAYNLAMFLKRKNVLGDPIKYDGQKQNVLPLIKGKTGIIFFQNFIEDDNRSYSAVHIDLWNKTSFQAPVEWLSQMMDASIIYFWQIN